MKNIILVFCLVCLNCSCQFHYSFSQKKLMNKLTKHSEQWKRDSLGLNKDRLTILNKQNLSDFVGINWDSLSILLGKPNEKGGSGVGVTRFKYYIYYMKVESDTFSLRMLTEKLDVIVNYESNRVHKVRRRFVDPWAY